MRSEIKHALAEYISEGVTVLDYGPLEGAELEELVQAGAKVTAVNVSQKTQIEGVTYASPEALAPNSYDLVICAYHFAYGHRGYSAHLAKLLTRVVRPGGVLVVVVPFGLASSTEFTRFFGDLRVMTESDLLDAFDKLPVMRESLALLQRDYQVGGGFVPINYDEALVSGIFRREVLQVAVYTVARVSSKKTARVADAGDGE